MVEMLLGKLGLTVSDNPLIISGSSIISSLLTYLGSFSSPLASCCMLCQHLIPSTTGQFPTSTHLHMLFPLPRMPSLHLANALPFLKLRLCIISLSLPWPPGWDKFHSTELPNSQITVLALEFKRPGFELKLWYFGCEVLEKLLDLSIPQFLICKISRMVSHRMLQGIHDII